MSLPRGGKDNKMTQAIYILIKNSRVVTMSKYKKTIYGVVLSGTLLALVGVQAYADDGCDAEVAAIRVALDAPDASVSAANLEKAQQIFNVLVVDCSGGTPHGTVSPMAQQIRILLNIGDAQ